MSPRLQATCCPLPKKRMQSRALALHWIYLVRLEAVAFIATSPKSGVVSIRYISFTESERRHTGSTMEFAVDRADDALSGFYWALHGSSSCDLARKLDLASDHWMSRDAKVDFFLGRDVYVSHQ